MFQNARHPIALFFSSSALKKKIKKNFYFNSNNNCVGLQASIHVSEDVGRLFGRGLESFQVFTRESGETKLTW